MNIYKKFYKDYYPDNIYNGIDNDKVLTNITNVNDPIKQINDRIISSPFTDDRLSEYQQNEAAKSEDSFELEVAYPGLITGVGITHEVGGIESELKLGMHFDYTTGLPVIYGSTVKGVLKSYLKYYEEDYTDTNIDFIDLEKEIFEGLKRVDNGGREIPKGDRTYAPMSIYARDVFFDAVVIKSKNNDKILDKDTICPHTEGPLKNPNPISFLKIASGVKIQFRFDLKDSGMLDAEKKRKLFKTILRDFGIGAKTNVGYGQFL